MNLNKLLMLMLTGGSILTVSGFVNDLITDVITPRASLNIMSVIGAVIVTMIINILFGWVSTGLVKFFKWEE